MKNLSMDTLNIIFKLTNVVGLLVTLTLCTFTNIKGYCYFWDESRKQEIKSKLSDHQSLIISAATGSTNFAATAFPRASTRLPTSHNSY